MHGDREHRQRLCQQRQQHPESCTSNGNGNWGFDVGQGSISRNCQAENNAGQGIVCTYYSTITGNKVYANGAPG